VFTDKCGIRTSSSNAMHEVKVELDQAKGTMGDYCKIEITFMSMQCQLKLQGF
jgi:hypothetical protein